MITRLATKIFHLRIPIYRHDTMERIIATLSIVGLTASGAALATCLFAFKSLTGSFPWNKQDTLPHQPDTIRKAPTPIKIENLV